MENIDDYSDIEKYKITIQTFDPKSKVELSHEDYYRIEYKKIGVFEYGFDFVKKEKSSGYLKTKELFFDDNNCNYCCNNSWNYSNSKNDCNYKKY